MTESKLEVSPQPKAYPQLFTYKNNSPANNGPFIVLTYEPISLENPPDSFSGLVIQSNNESRPVGHFGDAFPKSEFIETPSDQTIKISNQ